MGNDADWYTRDHLWVKKIGENLFRIGVTFDYLDRLAAINIVELPEVEHVVRAGDSIAVLESSKAAVEIPSPFAGKIKNVNRDAVADPGLINRQPMADGWLVEIEADEPGSLKGLLSEDEYHKLL